MKVYLISCVGKKRSGSHPAKDLYISDWFVKARAYVEARLMPGDQVFILSALYGAVPWDTVIASYDQRLIKRPVPERRQWELEVAGVLSGTLTVTVPQAIKEHQHFPDQWVEIVLLAGQSYRNRWPSLLVERLYETQALGSANVHYRIPMQGLGIGQQLRWLKQHTPLTEREMFDSVFARVQSGCDPDKTLFWVNGYIAPLYAWDMFCRTPESAYVIPADPANDPEACVRPSLVMKRGWTRREVAPRDRYFYDVKEGETYWPIHPKGSPTAPRDKPNVGNFPLWVLDIDDWFRGRPVGKDLGALTGWSD
jgi:hypothetical protein